MRPLCLTGLRALAAGCAVALALAGAAPPAGAQEPPAEETAVERPPVWYTGIFGIHFDDRIGPAVGGGVVRQLLCRPVTDCNDHEASFFASLEPGWGGGRGSLGLAFQRGGGGFLVTARGSYLQRWSNWDSGYLGGEFSLQPFYFVGVRAGFFRALKDDVRPRRMTIVGFAVGL